MAANSYRNTFVSNIDQILTSGTTTALAIGELGIFDARTYAATTAPAYNTNPEIIIAQGTNDMSLPMGVGKANFTAKAPAFKASAVTKWEKNLSQLPKNGIVTIGYDGVDTSKTLTVKSGKQVRFWLTLSGQPVANMLGGASSTHYATLTEMFQLELPCVDECADNCDATVDCNIVADAIINEVYDRKLIGNQPLKDYVRATKLISCTTPSGLPTVDCQKWELVIPDNGNQVALGLVQAQYPAYTVTRTDRNGVYSTYELIDCDDNTPDDYIENNNSIIPNCTTCPSGYTFVDEYSVFQIVRDGNVSAATIASAYSGLIVTGSTIKLGTDGGSSTFTVYVDGTSLAAQATDIVTLVGTRQSLCVGNERMTYAWTEGDTCQKAQKRYEISLAKPNCDGDCDGLLATLQAEYESLGTVHLMTDNADTTCTCRFYLIVLSNESCITCAEQNFTFVAPWNYGTASWVDVQGDVYGTGCVCGVKFESAYVPRDRKECFFDSVSYEYEPLFIQLSSRNPDEFDYSQLCDEDLPVTILQTAQYAQGYGSATVSEAFKLSRFYFGDPWRTDPATRDAYGYELNVDLQGYYDEYILVYKTPETEASSMGGFGSTQFKEYELHFWFPAGGGIDFVNAINSYITFPGSTISPI